MSKTSNKKVVTRIRRHARVRSKISGTSSIPRLSVFKSNKALYAQVIDDENKVTLAAASSLKMKGKKGEKAKAVGVEIAKRALEKKIKSVVFDRGGFRYAGNIKIFADGAREGGLTF